MKKWVKGLFLFSLALILVLSGFFPAPTEAQAIWKGTEDPLGIMYYYADYDLEVLMRFDGSIFAQGYDSALVSQVNQWTNVAKLRCGYGKVAAVDFGGGILSAGFDEQASAELARWDDIYDIYLGIDYVLGLTMDGRVLSCPCYPSAREQYGLDKVDGWRDIEQLVLSDNSALAVDAQGRVYTLGEGGYTNQPGFDPGQISDALYVTNSPWINFCFHRDGRISFWGIDENRYDGGLIAGEGLERILPGDTYSVGIRTDGSSVLLGKGSCPDKAFADGVNSCRDISIAFFSSGNVKNNGLYVIHNDGRVEAILWEDSDVGWELKPEVESWRDVQDLYGGMLYVIGQRADGSLRVATAYPNSLLNSLAPG